MEGIKIQLNALTIDQINPNRLYTIQEACQILMISEQTLKRRIQRKRINPTPRRKFEHYKIFGSELIKYLKYSNKYEIEDFNFS